MNRAATRHLSAAAVAALLLLGAATLSAAPGDGVTGSRHDFSAHQPNGEICIFCHTPHNAKTRTLLWNHTLSSSAFRWNVARTTGGTDFAQFSGDTYGGPTAKCLSCHDGTVAVGDYGYLTASGQPPAWDYKIPSSSAYSVGPAGDLKGTHPVSMPYPFMNQASTYNGVTTGAHVALDEWLADPTAAGIPLYTDFGTAPRQAAPQVGRTGIECTSCHDPHNQAVSDVYFLRGSLSSEDPDYICAKCHEK
ncbi:MAG: hypothetical protein HYV63_29540 [Candidatus Schekmanbacteria bacterium]|nr:hypothetical protein [Candidatus Schekmanbacteria bacterium]